MSEPVFFSPSRLFTVGDIGVLTGAELLDPSQAERPISSIAAAADGRDGALVFVEGKRNAGLMRTLRAAAVLCSPDIAGDAAPGVAVLTVRRPQQAFAMIGRLMFPEAGMPRGLTGRSGVSSRAIVEVDAIVETGATIEPGAYVGSGAWIGRDTVVSVNAVIGPQCRVGRGGFIGPGAVVRYALIGDRVIVHGGAQIGQDGFGFVPGPRGPERMPQLGRVIIQDDVEIGANTTIDRGALADTVIGDGTKIDNLVQIGHNVRIGRGCIVAGQCGISGSVVIGDFAMLGGSVGLSDHVVIGAGAQVAAGSGVMETVPDGARWGGSPAVPMRQYLRQVAMLRAMGRHRKGEDNG